MKNLLVNLKNHYNHLFGIKIHPATKSDIKHKPTISEANIDKGKEIKTVNSEVIRHNEVFKDEKGTDGKIAADANNEWKAPTIPASNLPTPPELTADYLPKVIREYVFHSALRLDDAPPEYVAVSVITAAAAVIGGSAVIAPKKQDKKWKLVPTIWSSIIGGPSVMKTPSMDAALRLIPVTVSKEEGDKSLVVNDATRAALAMKLSEEPHGILMNRDELTGWLSDLDDKKNRSERGFYLSAFNGNVKHHEIRVTRDKITLDAAIVSILGGIQPSMIIPFLKERNDGKVDDGMFERFQMTVFPCREMRPTDIPLDESLDNKAKGVFELLMAFRYSHDKKVFNFSDEAQILFDQYHKENIERRNKAEPHLQAMLGKYSALCAKLSLIFHLLSQEDIEVVSTTVDESHVAMALKWIYFVEVHYTRLMALVNQTDTDAAVELLIERLTALPHKFGKRELGRKGWKGIMYGPTLDRILQELVLHGYIKEIKENPNGRVRIRYLIHPNYQG